MLPLVRGLRLVVMPTSARSFLAFAFASFCAALRAVLSDLSGVEEAASMASASVCKPAARRDAAASVRAASMSA